MIRFAPAFNRRNLGKLSIINCAVAVLGNTTDDEIIRKDLNEYVARIKKTTVASVSGTLWGGDLTPPRHKLMGRTEVKGKWVRGKTSTGQSRIIKVGSVKYKAEGQLDLSYDTVGKQEARQEGPEWCLRKIKKKMPVILTMAGTDGHDVIGFLKIHPHAIIHNVEQNRDVFDLIMDKNLPITNYYGEIAPLLTHKPERFYDVVNFDSDGYISDKMDAALRTINEKKSTKYLCLTIQNLKKFRNSGKFIINLRKKYKGLDDPTTAYLYGDILSEYEIVKDFTYNRGQEGARSIDMRTIVYKRKGR